MDKYFNIQSLIAAEPHTWLTTLTEQFKVKAVRDGDLVSLKYDQIESPMREPIVQQCRGMVVCTRRNQILAHPYDKFWNHGEGLADTIDWPTARVQEKLDGSLMILYWDQVWCVASSGHPTAGGRFGSGERTFRDAFWSIVQTEGMNVERAESTITYMFELCDTPNRVVVRHDRPRLVLHGARDMITRRELSRIELEFLAGRMGCEIVAEYPLFSLADCLQTAATLNPLDQEGFVVVDARHNRVKIKSPRYVALHHLKGEMSVRRAIDLWRTGESSELLVHFPEFREEVEAVHQKLDTVAVWAARDFATNCPRASRKEFAAAVKELPWASILFKMIDAQSPGLAEARAIMGRMSVSTLERFVMA